MAKIHFNQGDLIRASDVNSNFDEIYDGTGLDANAITKGNNVFGGVCSSQTISAAAGMTNITGMSGTLVTTGGDLLMILSVNCYKNTNSGKVFVRLSINSGASYWPDGTGYFFYINTLNEHNSFTWTRILAGLAAGSYPIQLQMQAANDNVLVNADDYEFLTVIELKK